MELIIGGEEDAQFEEIQIEAYKKIIQNKDNLLKKCEEKTYDYYQEVISDYRDRYRD